MKNSAKGFSLIELMIVIAIIGILAAIAVPSYQSYVTKSKLGELFSAAASAQLAVAEYLESSGADNCNSMPIVMKQDGVDTWLSANTGAFPYPNSNLVSSVGINNLCNVFVVGQPGQWGSIEDAMGQPIVVSHATIDSDGAVSFSCFFAGTLGNSNFLPIKPTQCIGYAL